MEKVIDQYLKDKVKAAGGYCYKLEAKGTRGWPDRFVGFPDGRSYWIELKTERGVIEYVQRVMLTRLAACGLDVRIIRGMKDAQTFLAEVTGGDPYEVE